MGMKTQLMNEDQRVETPSGFIVTPSEALSDADWIYCDSKENDSDVTLIELIKDNDGKLGENNNVLGEDEFKGDHFDKFPTRSVLVNHKYMMSAPLPSMIMSNLIIVEGNPLNLKIPCNIGHVHIGRAYIDLDSPINIMSRGSWNFTYASDFMIVEDISSVIDPRMSPVILGKPFVELSNMTYDSSLGMVKFTKGVMEITYKMPYKIEQYDSLSNEEKENIKSVYFRNDEDKKKGVEYVMTGSESRPPMLNKENYVPWSSRLIRYAKSRSNGKLIHNSILNGPYVRRMIAEPGDGEREVNVHETFHERTDDELSERELKQIEADDQAIQTILLGLPEDIYAAEKKAKLFNEWKRFTSNKGESIESYYHRFLKLMNDLKRNKHFPEKIASNLKFLNNLQPEWSRHVTIVHQTKDLHTADYTQLYDFLKYNQKGVDELKAERIAKVQDPLALMANSNNLYVSPAPHQDLSPFNQNFLQQPVTNPKDITDPTTAMNMQGEGMLLIFRHSY
uniref:Gag-Pol polyprotein n=1 Tax=Tanacetum cinerariifolium TaxID=118510 RepID=A0A6L2JP35_TANCI|nr:Gag-Pol polyprotein [Tanacetum cinerariifolium]